MHTKFHKNALIGQTAVCLLMGVRMCTSMMWRASSGERNPFTNAILGFCSSLHATPPPLLSVLHVSHPSHVKNTDQQTHIGWVSLHHNEYGTAPPGVHEQSLQVALAHAADLCTMMVWPWNVGM